MIITNLGILRQEGIHINKRVVYNRYSTSAYKLFTLRGHHVVRSFEILK